MTLLTTMWTVVVAEVVEVVEEEVAEAEVEVWS